MVDVGGLSSDPDRGPHDIRQTYENSDGWDVESWSRGALVVSRAALKDMLVMIEAELGRRKLMGPHR